ncbi:hypothetical protein [Legionella sp.]|uniref:hypothetical protein n=1 Tax=Legionella sp. TaxID=459 RepID=UPI000CB8E624|nr:hypothetical protein [Legionella sp.]PJE09075.1 MAG: hypothetical protein CK430_11360 [Legionella sp.]
MFRYYSVDMGGQQVIYKFDAENVERGFFQLDIKNRVWAPFKIESPTTSDNFREYKLAQDGTSLKITLKESRLDTSMYTQNLLMEIVDCSQTIPSSTTWVLVPFEPGQELKSRFESMSDLEYVSAKSKKEEPVKSTGRTKTGRSNSSSSTFFHNAQNSSEQPRVYENYTLTEEQRSKLKEHKTYLENRWTEYSLLSYICVLFCCFSQGISKTAKINEIDLLLSTGVADPAIVRQGYTGSILRQT